MKIIIVNQFHKGDGQFDCVDVVGQATGFIDGFMKAKEVLGCLRSFWLLNEGFALAEAKFYSNKHYEQIDIKSLKDDEQKEIYNYFLYKEAKKLAVSEHSNQSYGGFLPYWYHLKQTDKVVDYFYSEIPQGKFFELKCAAWLHDILEDTVVDLEKLTRDFGNEIADIVLKVTKINEQHNLDYETAYYKEMAKNPLSIFIKIADKCSNTKQTLKNKSGWHAKRLVKGHPSFVEQTYDKIDASALKFYLDSLIAKMAKIVASGNLCDCVEHVATPEVD